MKGRLFTVGLILLLNGTQALAQRQNRIGYIDMDYILENVPEYKQANKQLDRKIQAWKEEVEKKQDKIDDLKQELNNERPLLTQDLIEEREDEIELQEKKLKKFQETRFGVDGHMINARKDIVKPVQDEVFNVVREIGEKRDYDFIFDSSSNALMLFSAKRHDISDQVLTQLSRNKKEEEHDGKIEERKKKEESDAEDYKPVKKARKDKERKEKRRAKKKGREKKRKAGTEQREKIRDSIKEARQSKYENRQAKKENERQFRRDSIKEVSRQKMEKRKERQDSVQKPQKKRRKNRDNH